MYDTDLKRRTLELAYGINVDNGKSDCTKLIGIRQAAKLLGVWNQSSIVKWRQQKLSDSDIKYVYGEVSSLHTPTSSITNTFEAGIRDFEPFVENSGFSIFSIPS